MGNDHYIVDIKGFECYHEDINNSNISLMLDLALGEGKERLEEIEDEVDRELAQNLYDKIQAIDDGIYAIMSDQCMGGEPMAIGWGLHDDDPDFKDATEEKMNALKEALIAAGYKVEPLYKDRFSTYG
jgi:hypothetical protein